MSHIQIGNTVVDVNQAEEAVSEGWSVPTDWYRNPDIYQFERENIFEKSWLYVAPREWLSKPGDTITAQIGETPIVIVRNRDGALRGFVNVCRHRGYAVVQEDGNYRSLVCRYHGFTYGLDGELRGAPSCQNIDTLKKDNVSLVPVSVFEFGLGVYANVDPNAKSMEEQVPEFFEVAKRRKFNSEPADYKHAKRIGYDVKTNWKVWYDNHVECYHCGYIHGETFNSAYDGSPENVDTEMVGQLMTYTFKSQPALNNHSALKTSGYKSIQLFPGILFIQQDDVVMLSQSIPSGPETTTYHIDFFGEVGADPNRVQQWIDIWDQTFKEDAEATEIQQHGLRAGRVPLSRLVPEAESQVVFMNKKVVEVYRRVADANAGSIGE